MPLLGRLRTGPRLFAALRLVFALSSAATVVGLVGLGNQHAAAVDADPALARQLHALVGQFTV